MKKIVSIVLSLVLAAGAFACLLIPAKAGPSDTPLWISNCEDTAQWVANSAAYGALTGAVKDNRTEGASAMKFTPGASGFMFYAKKDLNITDIISQGYTKLEFDIWVSGSVNVATDYVMNFSTVIPGTGGYNVRKNGQTLTPGWNSVKMDILTGGDSTVATDAGKDLTKIKGMRFYLNNAKSTTYPGLEIVIDNLRFTDGTGGNALLSSLSATQGKLNSAFSKYASEGTMRTLAGTSALTLNYAAETAGATVSVSGNAGLSEGSAVTLTVTSPGGVTTAYKLNITFVEGLADSPVLLTGCDDAGKWTPRSAGGYGTVVGLDKEHRTEGEAGIRLQNGNGSPYNFGFCVNISSTGLNVREIMDSGRTYAEFDVWASQAVANASALIVFTKGTVPTVTGYSCRKYSINLQAGWNKVSLNLSAHDQPGVTFARFDAGRDETDLTGTKSIYFQVTGATAAGAEIVADNIRFTDGTPENASDSALLSNLSVSNGTLDKAFGKHASAYTVSLPYGTGTLDLDYTPEKAGSTVTVSGNEGLADGGAVTVSVASPLGVTAVYKLTADWGERIIKDVLYIADCDTSEGWSVRDPAASWGAAPAIAADNRTEGAAALKFQPGTSGLSSYLATDFNLPDLISQGYTKLEFDLWASAAVTTAVAINFTTAAGANGYDVRSNYSLNPGWNSIEMDFRLVADGGIATLTAPPFDGTAAKRANFYLPGAKPEGFTCVLDNLRFTSGDPDEALLSTLGLTNGVIKGGFSPYKSAMTVYVEPGENTLDMTPALSAGAAAAGAQIAVAGNENLGGANNHVTITVTSPRGVQTVYTLTAVVRQPGLRLEAVPISECESETGWAMNPGYGALGGAETSARTQGSASLKMGAAADKGVMAYLTRDTDVEQMMLEGYEFVEFDLWASKAFKPHVVLNFVKTGQAGGYDLRVNNYQFSAGWNRVKLSLKLVADGGNATDNAGGVISAMQQLRFYLPVVNGDMDSLTVCLDNLRFTSGEDDSALLGSLSVKDGDKAAVLAPAFDPRRPDYETVTEYPVALADVAAAAAQTGADVEISEDKPNKKITVTVTSLSGVKAVYVIRYQTVMELNSLPMDGVREDKYVQGEAIGNAWKMPGGMIPVANAKNTEITAWSAYDTYYNYLFLTVKQDSFDAKDYLEVWIDPDPSYKIAGEMAEGANSDETAEICPWFRFLPGTSTMYGSQQKKNLWLPGEYKLTAVDETTYTVELRCPRVKGELSFTYTAAVRSYTSDTAYYAVAPTGDWWRFHKNQFEVKYDDIEIGGDEEPGYLETDDENVLILGGAVVVYKNMTLGELSDALITEDGVTLKFRGAGGAQIKDLSTKVSDADAIEIWINGKLVKTYALLYSSDGAIIPVGTKDGEGGDNGGGNGADNPGTGDPAGLLPAACILFAGAVLAVRKRKTAK